jgi:hypothetical protein
MQISPTYVKQAYSLAWRFFNKNKLASFLAMAIIFGLYMLSIIPLLGMFIAIAAGISLFSLQTYVAKTLISSKSDEEYDEKVQNSTVKEMLTEYLGIASGGFLGFVVIEIIMLVVMFTLLTLSIGIESLTQFSDQTMTPEQQMQILQSVGVVGLIFMLVVMFLAYIYPLVLGKVYTSENFGEAFSAIFTMFSPTVWKASLNGQYFFMIMMLHLTGIGMVIVMAISMMTIVLIPLAFIVAYLFILYATTTAVLAREIVFENDTEENTEE